MEARSIEEGREARAEAEAGGPTSFLAASDQLSALERFNIAFIRKTFELGWLDGLLRQLQRFVGATWIDVSTRRLRHVHGLERVGPLDAPRSVIFASNHRSFFDLYVISTVLYRAGFRQRMLFSVRSNFFYDHPLGFLVNGLMSFWSMYPPIFRDKPRQALNQIAMDELARALSRQGRSTGMHPEGRRKVDDDPYTLLPARPGIGRLIREARAEVVPVFVNGLGNDLYRQVKGNFDGTGRKVLVVFGAPIDFGALREAPPGHATYKALAERTLEHVAALGQEERALRAELERR